MTTMFAKNRITRSSSAVKDMVLIPAGEFLMGSQDGGEFEQPVHKVFLDSYYMDETPVTNAEFAEFVRAISYVTTAERLNNERSTGDLKENIVWHGFATSDRQDHPVVCVSWYDANAYAKWAGKRLPTEAEWEKAARGKLENKRFPWGDESPEDKTNWNKIYLDSISSLPTMPVKSFAPNVYGIYDVAGNVWEWCNDWYQDDYYSISPHKNPQGPSEGHFRVRRGASWNVREDFRLRCANRGAMSPESFWPNIGFRCVLTVK